MNYTIPSKELVKIFIQIYIHPIANTLHLQQHKTFKEAVAQVVLIEKVKIQDEKIKVKKDKYWKFNMGNSMGSVS